MTQGQLDFISTLYIKPLSFIQYEQQKIYEKLGVQNFAVGLARTESYLPPAVLLLFCTLKPLKMKPDTKSHKKNMHLIADWIQGYMHL